MKTVALVAILGVPALLCLGLAYNTLSPREWAIGFLCWFAGLLLWAIVGKLATKKTPSSNAEAATGVDDDTRSRILRAIRIRKVWIGALAICLPIGIADGIAQHFYWQLAIGIAINLVMMHAARGDIKRLKQSLIADANS